MSKLRNVLDLLRYSSSVANPAAWKKGHITASIIGGLLWAIVGLTGYDHQIGSETVDAIAGGILALGNVLLVIITSKKVGLRDKRGAARK